MMTKVGCFIADNPEVFNFKRPEQTTFACVKDEYILTMNGERIQEFAMGRERHVTDSYKTTEFGTEVEIRLFKEISL